MRAAYGRAADEPGTTAVRDTAGNPPFAGAADGGRLDPWSNARSTRHGPPGSRRRRSIPVPKRLDAVVECERATATGPGAGHDGGLLGSRGQNLRLSRNINQPVDWIASVRGGVGRPARYSRALRSATSPRWRAAASRATTARGWRRPNGCRAGLQSTLVHLVEVARHQLAQFLRLRRAEQLQHCRPVRLVGFRRPPPVRLQRDVRICRSRESFLTRGWQLAAVVQAQSGNPVNIVTSNSSLNGVPNSVRPDVTGPIRIIGSVGPVVRSVGIRRCRSLRQSGPKRRRSGPAFNNTDLSLDQEPADRRVLDAAVPGGRLRLFNHPNFGPPGNIVGSPTFGKITRTRLPTGEAGSSRQIQIAVRLSL